MIVIVNVHFNGATVYVSHFADLKMHPKKTKPVSIQKNNFANDLKALTLMFAGSF